MSAKVLSNLTKVMKELLKLLYIIHFGQGD